MLGGRDGDRRGCRVDAELAAAGDDRREAALEEVATEVPRVEEDVVGPGRLHPVEDRPGDDVAGRQVGHRVQTRHEGLTGRVDEHGALAAHGL